MHPQRWGALLAGVSPVSALPEGVWDTAGERLAILTDRVETATQMMAAVQAASSEESDSAAADDTETPPPGPPLPLEPVVVPAPTHGPPVDAEEEKERMVDASGEMDMDLVEDAGGEMDMDLVQDDTDGTEGVLPVGFFDPVE